MKELVAQPGYSVADVEDLLASRQFVYAECYTITPIFGGPLRYTNVNTDVAVVPIGGGPGRVVYAANQVILKGLKFRSGVGVQVDEQNIELHYTNAPIYQAAIPWPQALQMGRLDGATVRRDRFFAPRFSSANGNQNPYIGGLQMFAGRVSSLDAVGRQSATVNVKSDMVLLAPNTPRDLWQPQCKNTWGDPGCGLDQSAFAVQTTVGASPTRNVIPWAGITDDYVMGKLYIEGGDNVTRVRTILKVNAGVSAEVIYPLDFDPLAGQDVVFYPNCRRQFDRCGNFHVTPEEHFIGFPFVPVAETAV